MYYLVIVEIPVARVVACGGEACRVAVGDEAMRLADEIQKKVVAEDEGFLVPVRNIWIVDKLRADLAACKNELAACKNELAACKNELAASKNELAAKDKEIERLKQQISKKK
jgi:septal ring factor EnvC (AmiA/AmiB activator)